MLPLETTDRRFLLRAARFTIESYLSSGQRERCRTTSSALLVDRAAFVTLRCRDTGALRGCRGETEPRRPLVESVTRHAIAAAVDDPRFPKVNREELDNLSLHISALTMPKVIAVEEIVLGRHGLLMSREGRSGLLLPQVPALYELNTVSKFLEALCRKASLPLTALNDPRTLLMGFEAEEWGEEDDSSNVS